MIPRHSNRSAYYTTPAGYELPQTQVLVKLDKEDALALAANDRLGVVTAEKFAMYVVPWIEIPVGDGGGGGGENLGECILRAELVTPSSLVVTAGSPPAVTTAATRLVGGAGCRERGSWHVFASVDKNINFGALSQRTAAAADTAAASSSSVPALSPSPKSDSGDDYEETRLLTGQTEVHGALMTPAGKTKLSRPSRFIEHLDE